MPGTPPGGGGGGSAPPAPTAPVYRFNLYDPAGNVTNVFDVPHSKYDGVAAPTAGDDVYDGYIPGSMWVDWVGQKVYLCTDHTAGAAVWAQVAGGSTGGLTDGDKGDVQVSAGGTTWVVESIGGRLNLATSLTDTISADQNDYSPASLGVSSVMTITPTTSPRTITGLDAGTNSGGRFLLLFNGGSVNLILAHESASSSANNRFKLPSSANLTIPPNGGELLYWNNANSRWMVIG